MTSNRRLSILMLAGFVAGVTVSFAGLALSGSKSAVATPSTRAYVVSIDEIKQNFVFAEKFSGNFTRKVSMSDGTLREIALRPVIKDGLELVELSDRSSGHNGLTYMGRNGTTTNGTLMINVRDVAQLAEDCDAVESAH